ncbi:MAG: hypothetical protein WCF44_09965 [Candidatus Methylophosphatis roskildensis]|uniref:Uncharacterized protein n=1 Tax=Candidatus Methylophosphatis roskildensis TaxID=2899263 RepID=A0A9D7HN88_9PROT|nr:hypothetical protein [Candidatus Methylophosphatis roskildensis]MBK7237403.1 hypothetical protein [Sterolibacteriaceae bacterium]
MNAIVIEHVKVSELPAAWRAKLGGAGDVRVTVHIEQETAMNQAGPPEGESAFGMWAERADMADVQTYVRQLRTPRHGC